MSLPQGKDNKGILPSSQVNGAQSAVSHDRTQINASNQPTFTQGPSNSTTLKIPRKRPLGANTPELGYLNGSESRPASASTTGPRSDRPSPDQTLQQPLPRSSEGPIAASARSNRFDNVFPKANVIQPDLLLSYLSQPKASRPMILLLDVRPKAFYERGCLDAEYVVWVDPILLDNE
jgi:hypothetical protein